jgi:hypothetical protein
LALARYPKRADLIVEVSRRGRSSPSDRDFSVLDGMPFLAQMFRLAFYPSGKLCVQFVLAPV